MRDQVVILIMLVLVCLLPVMLIVLEVMAMALPMFEALFVWLGQIFMVLIVIITELHVKTDGLKSLSQTSNSSTNCAFS